MPSAGSWLADVYPMRDVDLFDEELEQRVVGNGLAHRADPASVHDLRDRRSRGIVEHLVAARADPQFMVAATGQCVDHRSPIATQILTLWGGQRYRC